MKISSVALLLASVCVSNAWVAPTFPEFSGNNVELMASKGAKKWARKQEWLKKRGWDDDGIPDEGGATNTIAVIGAGRIGGLLATGEGDTVILGREDAIDANGSGPILIATRNDSLDGIVEECPENRRKDLVFLQNGYLDNFLQSKGLMDNTQVLLYLSVAAKGVDAVDGVTSVNPEGLTAATGEHAQAFSDLLASLNLKCNVVDAAAYRPAMFEKLM